MTGQDRDQLLAEATRVLTAAARLTRPVLERRLASTEAGDVAEWVDSGRTEPDDWAEFVTLALAGAAANVGSIEAVLAGRPGSWEADGVRQLLTSTVGYDGEYLLEHRTEPVVVTAVVEEVLFDLGADDVYYQAAQEIADRWTASGLDDVDEDDWTDEQQRTAAELERLEVAIEDLRKDDWAAYGAALEAAVQAAVARRKGLRVPVTVDVDARTLGLPPQRPAGPWGLAEQLLDEAIQAVPLPGDGQPPLERLQAATS